MMFPLSADTTIGELVQSGLYGEFANYFFTWMTPDHWHNRLSAYGFETVGFETALRRMRELADSGQPLHFPVYSAEERLSSWDLATVQMEFFPAPQTDHRLPYVLILPGGGFNRHWGLIEGQAIAARANALGFPAFVLYYRVKQEPVMPLPLKDVSRAISLIEQNASRFHVSPGQYMVCGFSAGASVAGCLLTERFSWKTLGIPRPSAMALAYIPARFDEFFHAWASAPEGSPQREGSAAVLRRVGGPSFTLESLSPYNIPAQLAPDIPPVYLTANLDDPVVPVANTFALMDALKERRLPCRARIGKTGGHSYGLGIGLEAEGWFDEALDLWRNTL